MVELLFPDEMLRGYGCRNCVWKELGQCPSGLEADSELPDGYCTKLVDFLVSLANGEDSISAVKEKYHIFIQEVQSLEDRKEFVRLQAEYKRLLAEGYHPDELKDLVAKINIYKVWWSRLSENVVKGLGRIADREKKVQSHQQPRLTIQQLNMLMRDSANKLIDLEKGEVKDEDTTAKV